MREFTSRPAALCASAVTMSCPPQPGFFMHRAISIGASSVDKLGQSPESGKAQFPQCPILCTSELTGTDARLDGRAGRQQPYRRDRRPDQPDDRRGAAAARPAHGLAAAGGRRIRRLQEHHGRGL
ncbi:hypothetical protein BOS5A_110774 [Bosea sp. EC-HK365B]|nr:hypothetical protein BOSE7B_110018 [Bosea sp. 7B]CAD5282159.1 hypothetical protein BOSE21B_31017 [Bosea sp. 21B]VVT52539.1 hypothetical protein BOS5A_110774 [Bosea sp. EC-HK365B]